MYTMSYRNASQISNVIEIVGMPAVGKSTYTAQFVRDNPEYADINSTLPQNHFVRQMYKLFAIGWIFFSAPGKWIRDVRLIGGSRQRSTKELLKVCADWTLVTYMMKSCRKHADKKFIFDQGVFQEIWSIAYSAKSPEAALPLLDGALLPGSVVFLDEDDETLCMREKNRAVRIRLNYADPQDVAAARKAMRLVVDYLDGHYAKAAEA